MNPDEVLAALERTLIERRDAAADDSYTAALYAGGNDAILKKLGEEATEVLIAAKNADDDELVHELADLWYHAAVLMAHRGITLDQLTGELARRMNRSGHAEKAARGGGS